MSIVPALGANALLLRGQGQDAAQQLANVERAAAQIALIAAELPAHEFVITHGNGPQVGLVARELQADVLLIATDVPALDQDWGLPSQRALDDVSTAQLRAMRFAAGSMAPKVAAACDFVELSGHRAVIGSLDQTEAMLRGDGGTQITGVIRRVTHTENDP